MSFPVNLTEIKPIVYCKNEKLFPLTIEEVHRRQKLFGKNIIKEHSARSWFQILLNSLFDPFNVLLIGISCLSLFLNETYTFVIMAIMVIISSGIRFFQEQQSETKLNDLTSIIKKNTITIRKNQSSEYEQIINVDDCVPGDWIILKAGDRVPADMQLIKANSLFVDQSILTGESMPCFKCVPNDSKKIIINYDLNNCFINLKKKKNFNLKSLFLSCLKNSFGLNIEDKKFKLNNNTLMQFDRNDLLFMGTNIISGNGLGIILATGQNCFIGIMSEQISFHKPLTSFNKAIKQISIIFIVLMIIILIPIIIFKGFGLFKDNKNLKTSERWINAAQFALSVAIGLTPELLNMILNANCAKGSINLSKRNCIVKRIESITNLGSMNILCSDKTGTITENYAQLCNIFDVKRQDCLIGLDLAYLNSAYQDGFKNLTDQAIINYYENKIKQTKLIDNNNIVITKINEIPFDFTRRKVTVVYEIVEFNMRCLITKGAVNEMLNVCSYYLDQTQENINKNILSLHNLFKILKQSNDDNLNFDNQFKIKKLTPDIINQLHSFNDHLNQDGYRVLAVAFKVENFNFNNQNNSNSLKIESDKLSNLDEKNLIFVCFLTFLNPPKQSTAKAIQNLIASNVSIKILTGDTQEVCRNVCKQIGLSADLILNSKQLNDLNEFELKEAAIKNVIFSQLTPIQKYEIVKILKTSENVVGFLGDGINDVLALKEADVGISVDTGTEIAKDAADIILLEKSIDVINDGLFFGRKAFINTVKYIAMAISGNFGNVISIFVACLTLDFLPMSPIHILLQNLLYDISQMMIPWDNVCENDLKKPEVFKIRKLIYFMLFFGPLSSLFDIITFAFLYFYYNIKTIDDNVELFQTCWFTIGLLTQTLVCHVLRTNQIPIIQSNASYQVYFSTLTSLIFGLLLPFTPLGQLFKMSTLPISFYYFLIFILIFYCLSAQLLKRLYICKFKSWFNQL